MGPYRKNSGAMAGVELYTCANIDVAIKPAYTNRTVSANFRGPEYPQGFFGIQSMMDDVAHRLKIGPGGLRAQEHDADVPRRSALHRTTRSTSASAAAPRRSTGRRGGKPQPGSDPGPIKRGAGMTYMSSAPASARAARCCRLNARGEYTLFVGVTDVGRRREDDDGHDRGARRLDVPLSTGRRRVGRHRPLSVLGRRVGQPHHHHDRRRRHRGGARPEEADRREGAADRRSGAGGLGHPESAARGQGPVVVRRPLRRSGSRHRARRVSRSPSTWPSTTRAGS